MSTAVRIGVVWLILLAGSLWSCGGSSGTHDAKATDKMVCNEDRPSTAYRASATGDTGEPLADSDAGAARTPCSQLTGLASSETSLGVFKDGTLIVSPVITPDGTGVVRSRNRATTWDTLLPGKLGGAQHGRVQPFMFVDPTTQRVLFATSAGSGGNGFNLSLSDDQGSTWRASSVGAGSVDWIKIVGGPPATPSYPSTLYASSPSPISTAFADHQQVLRSLDGGQTWTAIDHGQLSLHPEQNGCAAGEWVIYGSGVVASDGSLYLGFRRCTRLGIAVTHDQGATWSVRDVPGAALVAYGGILSHFMLFNLMTPEPLAIDSDGNLYAIWNDEHDVLKFAVSRDAAVTWSSPLAVAPPKVTHTVLADLDVETPGVIAIAYYGSEDEGATYNAYASESLDALSATPTFRGVQLNPPDGEPLFAEGFDMGYSELLSMGDLVEMVRVAYAPDGTIWASFAKDMCPGMDRSHCTWDPAAHADAPYQLVMTRLERH